MTQIVVDQEMVVTFTKMKAPLQKCLLYNMRHHEIVMHKIDHFRDLPTVRLRTSRTLPLFLIMTSRLKHWKYYEALLNAYDVIMKNNGKVRDVRSLACKIKVLNGRVLGT